MDEAALKAAREKHYEAQCTGNGGRRRTARLSTTRTQATESLNKSMTLSQEGIKILDDAMKAKRAAK